MLPGEESGVSDKHTSCFQFRDTETSRESAPIQQRATRRAKYEKTRMKITEASRTKRSGCVISVTR